MPVIMFPLVLIITGSAFVVVSAVLRKSFGVSLTDFQAGVVFMAIGVLVLAISNWLLFRWRDSRKPEHK